MRIYLRVCERSKTTAEQTREEHFIPVRPLHRHRRIRPGHVQVQHQSEVTPAPGNWSDSPKNQEEFTDNLEDTAVPAPVHISHESDSERLTKVASKKYRSFTHLPTISKLRSVLTWEDCSDEVFEGCTDQTHHTTSMRWGHCPDMFAPPFLRTTLRLSTRTARRSYKSSSRTGKVAMMGTQRRQVKESLKPERR